jgi:hypothetical protein
MSGTPFSRWLVAPPRLPSAGVSRASAKYASATRHVQTGLASGAGRNDSEFFAFNAHRAVLWADDTCRVNQTTLSTVTFFGHSMAGDYMPAASPRPHDVAALR